MPKRITLQLFCDELDDSRLQSLTRDLRRSLNEEGLDAMLPTDGDGGPSTKGGPIDWNTVILTLIGSGGVAVGLIQVLKSYVERKSSLRYEIVRADKQTFLLTTKNLSRKQLHETTRAVEAFLKS
jgi:hypothetical protein